MNVASSAYRIINTETNFAMLPGFFTTLLLISGVAAMPPTKPQLEKPTAVELFKRVDPTGVRPKAFYPRDSLPDIFNAA